MKRLQDKLPTIWPVSCHTDHIGPGSTFVVIKGFDHDGASYIGQAIQKGATRIVIAQDVLLPTDVKELIAQHNVVVQRVQNTRLSLAQLSAQAHGDPAQKLCMIGITGTKGKTTTAFLTHHILQQSGIKAALLSTVHNQIGDQIYCTSLTTPQPDYLHMFLATCVDRGITHVVMEVAAQALSLQRVHGIYFSVGAFTNFGHEHMEFYASMDEYLQAKCLLFDHMQPNAPCIVNRDDAWLKTLLCDSSVNIVPLYLTDIDMVSVHPHLVLGKGSERIVVPALMGRFNAYNVVMSMMISQQCGISLVSIKQALAQFTGIKGRLQKHVLHNGATCYVDYAHTPDSYEQLLSLLRSLTDDLTVVFGCAGNKDQFKRSKMGAVAACYADKIILTADNPGHEDPQQICAMIMADVSPSLRGKFICEFDRKRAIELACIQSRATSIIAILGKGPDEYQQIGSERCFFSDTQVVQSLQNRPL